MKCSAEFAELISGFINHSSPTMNKWPPQDFDLDIKLCKLSSDIGVRYSGVEEKYSLKGACGLNPKQTFSVSINEEIYLNEVYSPKCGGLSIKSILVSDGTIDLCKYSEVSNSAPWVNIPEPAYECAKIPLNKSKQQATSA